MSRLAVRNLRSGAMLLAAAALLVGCKGGASFPGGASGAGAGANQNAVWGGGPAGTGAGARTDAPPDLVFPESQLLRAGREFESWSASGEVTRIHETLTSDGAGRLQVLADAVWDEAAQTWNAPHPLLAALYDSRAMFLARLRDLHLHRKGLFANYRWETAPGTTMVAGRNCETTRAISLHGLGPVDFVHESGTGLLLGWTVWNSAGNEPLMRLTTLTLDEQPNLAGMSWAQDLIPEQAYDPNLHDALLGFVPRQLDHPPAGFYREKAVVADVRGVTPAVSFVYLEHWSDGVRTLFVMQHSLGGGTAASVEMSVARMSREGGVVAVETDLGDRRVAAVGTLPDSDVLMVVGDLRD